ncbi:hypothetical protein AHF37_04265 [Paragonimus kellicotti]|nr:hypothetical protein AHF37_04265 [Paragonimus kellicotti]
MLLLISVYCFISIFSPTMDVAFDELVQDSEKLLMDVQGYTDLPYINRSLDQMKTFGDKLYLSRGPRSDVKAARLLGNKMSYELPSHLSAKLESLSTPGAVETTMPSPKLDIQAFLKIERENALLNVISMTQESLFENIENRTTRALRSWWEQEAAGVLSSLVGCSGPIDTDLLHQTISRDRLDSSTYVDGETGRTTGRTREELCYSKQLFENIENRTTRALRSWWEQEAAGVLSSLVGCSGPIDTDLLHQTISRDRLDSSTYVDGETGRTTGRTREELCYSKQVTRLIVCSFLKIERENALLNVISMTQESLFENIENRTTRALRSWWEQEAAGVLSSLVGCSGPIDTDLLHQTISRDRLDSSTYVDGETGRTTGRTREELCYSKQLDRYLSSQASHRTDFGFQPRTDRSRNLLLFFAEANGSSMSNLSGSSRGSLAHSDVVEIWNLFRRFGESLLENERSGATAHTPLELRALPCVQRKLVECSLAHLESEFVHFMRTTVDSNPRLAKLGGRPGTRALVKAYLNLCLSSNCPDSNAATSFSMVTEQDGVEFEDGIIDGKPLWPVIYCCLRAGDSRTAIEIARAASHSTKLTPAGLFRALLVSPLYSLSVACEPVGSMMAPDVPLVCATYNTSACRTRSVRCEVHFDAWSQPLVYFKLLCLTQQFEGAIGFLARFEALRCHAIHLALALHHEKLLLVSDSVQSPLVCRNESDPLGFRRLNFARAIMLYTHLTPYYIRHVVGFSQQHFQSNHGSLYLFSFGQPGCIDRYSRTPDERQFVIAAVASALEARGHVMDAISLYQLAANSGHEQTRYYQKAVSLTNYLLAGLVATENIAGLLQTSGPRAVGHPDRSLVIRVATKLAHRTRQSDCLSFGSTVDEPANDLAFDGPSSLKTLFYLLDLATFFDLVQAEQWQQAVDHVDQLGLFPTNPQFEQVESKVMLFTQLPDYVRRPLPAALIALMRCLVTIASRSRSVPLSPGSLVDDSSNLTLSTVRNRAKALIAYVGRIPYKLSGDVYARLTQMQMEIM